MSSDAHEPGSGTLFQHRPSALPITLSLLLVAGAILFGIYGPQIAGRLSQAGGIPLVDMVDAASDMRLTAVMETFRDRDAPDLDTEEARGLVLRYIGRNAAVRDLAPQGYHLKRVGPASPPGAKYRGAVIVYAGEGERSGHWIVLFLAADEGQFISFDSLGRPRPLMPDMTLEGELAQHTGGDATALVWSDGPVLHVACFETSEEAHQLAEAIGAP
jgi:hypothetical protein